ncbi:MAG: hypothetical protein N2116_02350 [Armatimonadetes bacterium]|nr:hypothetical protein [Armatimonadota bacterium]
MVEKVGGWGFCPTENLGTQETNLFGVDLVRQLKSELKEFVINYGLKPIAWFVVRFSATMN